MRRTVLVAMVLSLAGWPLVSGAQVSALDKCYQLMNESGGAIRVSDWENLQRIARSFLAQCKNVVDDKTLSGAAEDVVMSLVEQQQFKQAVAEADSCIKIYYLSVGCHALKGQALLKLGDTAGARRSLAIGEKLSADRIESISQELAEGASGSMRKLLESERAKLISVRDYCQRLLKPLGP